MWCALRRHSKRRFNSRSRVGSDAETLYTVDQAAVSIHAPAWGATSEGVGIVAPNVFQFTLPRGERRVVVLCLHRDEAFQFTLPRGERRFMREASFWIDSFNSRSRVGSDSRSPRLRLLRHGFNSRSRVGSDDSGFNLHWKWRGFNSRSRVGSDRGGIRRVSMADYSVFCAEYNTN